MCRRYCSMSQILFTLLLTFPDQRLSILENHVLRLLFIPWGGGGLYFESSFLGDLRTFNKEFLTCFIFIEATSNLNIQLSFLLFWGLIKKCC